MPIGEAVDLTGTVQSFPCNVGVIVPYTTTIVELSVDRADGPSSRVALAVQCGHFPWLLVGG